MNPIEFQRKWIGVELKERSAAQEHFLDLCQVLGHPTLAERTSRGVRANRPAQRQIRPRHDAQEGRVIFRVEIVGR